MATYRGISRFLEGLLFATDDAVGAGARAGRAGRKARTAAYRVMNSRKGAAGFVEDVGSGLNRVAGVAAGKKFMVPFVLGMGGLGAVHGFTRSTLGSPEGYAIMSEVLSTNDYSGRNAAGRPLGVWNNNQYYPSYRINPQDPLQASGELALAMFATRHGR